MDDMIMKNSHANSGNLRHKFSKRSLLHLMEILLFTALFLLMLVRCDEPGYTRFVIKIDSLAHPDTVMVSQQVDFEFYGVVGRDGCHRFDTIQMEPLSDSLVRFTAWGERPGYQTVCPAVMVYLEGETYAISFATPGWQRIQVHQPGGSLFRDSLLVVLPER